MKQELTASELIKLAQQSASFRKKLIAEITKTANGDDDQNGSNQFNETVPANEEDEEGAEGKEGNQGAQQPPLPPNGEEAAAVPMPQEEQGPEPPEAVGARAAQAFIGAEVMEAAMQGDPAAMDLIARTAGQVAGAVAEANARAAAGAQTQAVPATGAEGSEYSSTGAQAVPAAGGTPAAPVANPTDELATEIAGAPQAAPAQAQAMPGKDGQTQVVPQAQNGAQPAPASGKNGGGNIDAAAIARLLELAKAGKI